MSNSTTRLYKSENNNDSDFAILDECIDTEGGSSVLSSVTDGHNSPSAIPEKESSTESDSSDDKIRDSSNHRSRLKVPSHQQQQQQQQQKNQKLDTNIKVKTDNQDMMYTEDKYQDNSIAEYFLKDDDSNVETSNNNIPDATLSNSSMDFVDFDSLYGFQAQRLLDAIQETEKSREIVSIITGYNPSKCCEDDDKDTTDATTSHQDKLSLTETVEIIISRIMKQILDEKDKDSERFSWMNDKRFIAEEVENIIYRIKDDVEKYYKKNNKEISSHH